MVYVGYCLFSLCGIPISIREVLSSLGGGMKHYLDIAQSTLKILVRLPSYYPRPLLEFPYVMNVPQMN